MVLIWSIYGSYMVHIWFLNVSYMVHIWFRHVSHMVFTWSIHGYYDKPSWIVTWFLRDLYMVLTCFLHGSYMIPTCLLQGALCYAFLTKFPQKHYSMAFYLRKEWSLFLLQILALETIYLCQILRSFCFFSSIVFFENSTRRWRKHMPSANKNVLLDVIFQAC